WSNQGQGVRREGRDDDREGTERTMNRSSPRLRTTGGRLWSELIGAALIVVEVPWDCRFPEADCGTNPTTMSVLAIPCQLRIVAKNNRVYPDILNARGVCFQT